MQSSPRYAIVNPYPEPRIVSLSTIFAKKGGYQHVQPPAIPEYFLAFITEQIKAQQNSRTNKNEPAIISCQAVLLAISTKGIILPIDATSTSFWNKVAKECKKLLGTSVVVRKGNLVVSQISQ